MQKELSLQRKQFAWQYVNGKEAYNATQSAVLAKYSPRTAKQQGQRLLTFVDVKTEISRLEAEKQAETAFNRARAELEYEQVRTLAITKRDLTAANQAIKGKAKLYGLEIETHQDITDQQRQLTESEQAEANRLASIRLREGA